MEQGGRGEEGVKGTDDDELRQRIEEMNLVCNRGRRKQVPPSHRVLGDLALLVELHAIDDARVDLAATGNVGRRGGNGGGGQMVRVTHSIAWTNSHPGQRSQTRSHKPCS